MRCPRPLPKRAQRGVSHCYRFEQAIALVVLYAEGDDPRAERALVRWLGRLFLEKPMAFALAARCVELVAELRGPEAERAARALDALARD
jgi:hypothetical protein